MILQGQFFDITNNLIKVRIETDSGLGTMTIGENGLYFAETEPVVIEEDIDDTFTTIITKSCNINLVTEDYQGDRLWSGNARNIKVNVSRNDVTIFDGFVEPQSFNQPFAYIVDEFSLNCNDYLTTLEYATYKDTDAKNYANHKSEGGSISFLDILRMIFSKYGNCNVYYDCSKSYQGSSNIFERLGINESAIYGDGADDVWTHKDCLDYILTYLNLHIRQEGRDFYIFDWDSVKEQRNTWLPIIGNGGTQQYSVEYVINKRMHRSDEANTSVTPTYNKIVLSCDTMDSDKLVVTPFDEDMLGSLYSGKQLYCSEYFLKNNHNSLEYLMNGGTNTDSENYEDRWFARLCYSDAWKFRLPDSELYNKYTGALESQDKVMRYLLGHNFSSCLVQLGSSKQEGSFVNGLLKQNPDLSSYLYISVNGNGSDPASENELKALINDPVAVYTGPSGGVTVSPTDDNTTNYIVFSGSVMLQPLYNEWRHKDDTRFGAKWWHADTPKSEPQRTNQRGIEMPKEDDYHGEPIIWKDHEQPLRFMGINGVDVYSKVPVLECELTIGNKRLIELNKFDGTASHASGNNWYQVSGYIDNGSSVNKYAWVEIGKEPMETFTEGGYTYSQKNTTFTIGFNPNENDWVYGKMFDFQNTVPHDRIDADGMAIACRKSDNLSGKIQFKIIGPVNLNYNNQLYRHGSFWRSSSSGVASVPILSRCQNIIVKDFKIEVYSDSNQNEVMKEKDLVYESVETEDYVEVKDDIEFKIFTGLSSDEYAEKGMMNTVYLNVALDMENNQPSSKIKNEVSGDLAIAEHHYIQQYYDAYRKPKVEFEVCLVDDDVRWNNIYDSTSLRKNFFVETIKRDLRQKTANIKLKEIGAYTIDFKDPVFAYLATTNYGSNNTVTVRQAKSTTFTSNVCEGNKDLTYAEYGRFGLEEIENNAFRNCTSLEQVDIPSSVNSIGDYAFEGCSSLSSVNISSNITSIGQGAFKDSAISSVTIPSSVSTIKNSTFEGCQNLSDVYIKQGVETISDNAFKGSGVESVSLPSSVNSVGANAFADSDIKSVSLGQIDSLGVAAFQNCKNLTSVTL